MGDTNPTLKIRLDVRGMGSTLGTSCDALARNKIIGGRHDIAILATKWGRPVAEWRESGGGWGRTSLDRFDRGYIDALRDSTAASDPVIANLLRIIGSVAS